VQKARFYQPTSLNHSSNNQEWGDGVATADKDICIWVGDDTALYLPMMAGPVGMPIFPLGVFEGEIERLDFFELSVWVVPKGIEEKNSFQFNPKNVFVEFTNGEKAEPISVQVSMFDTSPHGRKTFFGEHQYVERISSVKHLDPQKAEDVEGASSLWDWTRFVIRFQKPNKDIAPAKAWVKGLETKDGKSREYIFTFKEVEKHRYLVSGHHPNGEYGIVNPSTPCKDLFEKSHD